MNKRFSIFTCTTIVALLISTAASSQTPPDPCSALTQTQTENMNKILSTAYPYDCCDRTIDKCLTQTPICPLVPLLKNQVCRYIKKGKTNDEIKRILEQRALTMAPETKPVEIQKRNEMIWGNPTAATTLSIYLCPRCQFCARHIPELLDALEKNQLKDKVAVNLRIFPIKSHEFSNETAFAVETAAKYKKTWELLQILYKNYDGYSNENLKKWLAELQIEPEPFNDEMNTPEVRKRVVDSKKEGLKNDVTATPTFFINGRKIRSAFDTDDIIDMIKETL